MSCQFIAYTILVGAALLDFGLGDPWGWPHPVRWMGAYIQTLSNTFNYGQGWPFWGQRLGGAVLALSLITGSALISWGLVTLGMTISPLLGWGIAVVGTASGFAGRSLRDAATEVLEPLAAGNLEGARQSLAKYVGRETAQLEAPEILRAVLETVSENATDGMMAPLFYGAIATLMMPQLTPLPFVMAYKAASTLDSMIGYCEPPYTHWGWFAAKTEDVLTWLPCRLLVFLVALCSGQWQRVWQWCCRDAPKDPSPNSGWSECAYAAALGIRLGGTNTYRGTVKVKPFLGEPLQPIDQTIVMTALRLSRCIYLITLITTGGLAWVMSVIYCR
ncbi:MAG: adenosylcobinamide-phosphate synthase CbiB [Thermosynechococcus sp. Uc]|uniref:adenosylcobinamide-phosphate synthase CbiB n=1 Tax=Thermosynechococcus sp. Uc TaxID=3034853 RepID=UPI0019DE7783|nr:adenosylcobinamide-phosphate synthase CbiB [Thermosynechococcus sp. Uc]MDM7327288.1 adenosylcobinamide-phosphate synthase CbiB [Thermosynechococcus sp. Uc]HIK24299.1 cobalamin biosynthesis protein [Thermosynechococcus sp. M46_R2017_013]